MNRRSFLAAVVGAVTAGKLLWGKSKAFIVHRWRIPKSGAEPGDVRMTQGGYRLFVRKGLKFTDSKV